MSIRTRYRPYDIGYIISIRTHSYTHNIKIEHRVYNEYKNSFFVRTVADWNKLEDTAVTADSVTAFSSAVGRAIQGAAPPPPPPPHTHT